MNIEKMYNELSDQMILEGFNIPKEKIKSITINSRLKKTLGMCKTKRDHITKEILEHRIEIASYILSDPELTKQTIIHELIHTIPGCKGHDKTWKYYGDKASKLFNVDITRTTDTKNYNIEKEKPKYILKCKTCGEEYGYYRMSKAIKNYEMYKCNCSGSLELITN